MKIAIVATLAVALVLGALGVTFGLVQQSDSSHAQQQIKGLTQQAQELSQQLGAVQRTQTTVRTQVAAEKQAGSAVSSANLAHLGICWDASYGTTSENDGPYAESVDVESPIVSNGVYSCPQGDTYVTIVPQVSKADGGQ
jgi:ABC-type Na+ efflux pump permease subunit